MCMCVCMCVYACVCVFVYVCVCVCMNVWVCVYLWVGMFEWYIYIYTLCMYVCVWLLFLLTVTRLISIIVVFSERTFVTRGCTCTADAVIHHIIACWKNIVLINNTCLQLMLIVLKHSLENKQCFEDMFANSTSDIQHNFGHVQLILVYDSEYIYIYIYIYITSNEILFRQIKQKINLYKRWYMIVHI